MTQRYFDKFPEVTYNGFVIRNLMTSAKLINKYVNLPYNYYSYVLEKDERADTVANDYYTDPYMSWMVYYANKVVDPYYDWHLSEEDFASYIVDRYGSIEQAQRKIVCFVPNWFADSRELSPSAYESRFGTYKYPDSGYWNPVFNQDSGALLYYRRKVSNQSVNTNKLMCVAVSNNSPSKFQSGDLVDIKAGYNGVALGVAEVEKATTTFIYLKNIIGSVANTNLIVKESDPTTYASITAQSNTNDTTSSVWTITNIPDTEYVYWAPLTAYDLERENNTLKKTISLVEPILASKLADKLTIDLGE